MVAFTNYTINAVACNNREQDISVQLLYKCTGNTGVWALLNWYSVKHQNSADCMYVQVQYVAYTKSKEGITMLSVMQTMIDIITKIIIKKTVFV